MDIENLGNLISHDNGRFEQHGYPTYARQVVTLDQDLGPNGELIYKSFRNYDYSVNSQASLWKVLLGLRYRF